MEEMKETLTNMMDEFNNRMSAFETELQKTPNSPSSSTNLAADFAAFKAFTLEALGILQKQVGFLAQNVDRLEMRSKMLLLHGVPEEKQEETAKVVTKAIREQLKMTDFTESDIKRCHRMGRSSAAHKARPVVFKLQSVEVRDTIWFAKTKFKGTGITVSEFLTKPRHDVFMAAREKFGVDKCWTREGNVFILGADGTRHRISSIGDFNTIKQDIPKTAAIVTVTTKADVGEKVGTSRPKRAAAAKK